MEKLGLNKIRELFLSFYESTRKKLRKNGRKSGKRKRLLPLLTIIQSQSFMRWWNFHIHPDRACMWVIQDLILHLIS